MTDEPREAIAVVTEGLLTVESWAIPLAALIVSAAALIVVAFSTMFSRKAVEDSRRDAANKEYVLQLEKRIEECERGRHELRQEAAQSRSRYEEESIRLNNRYDRLVEENHDLRLRMLELERAQHPSSDLQLEGRSL